MTNPQEQLPPLKEFDAEPVQTRLRGLLINVDRDLERKLKQAMESRDRDAERRFSLLIIMVRLTTNSYDAIIFLLTDLTDNPKWKSQFALVVPPINRQLLDLLVTLVFMMDDFPARSVDYELAGYRQAREEYDKFYERFGADSEWQQYFANLQGTIQQFEHYLPLSPEQKANLKTIPYWRSLFKLKTKPTASQPFLEFLDNWLYGDTSAQAHLNAAGLLAIGLFVLSSFASDDQREVIEKRAILQYTYRHFTRTLTTVLAIATEIDNFCELNNREAAARTWKLLAEHVEEAKDVYEQRYQAMLA